MTYRSDPRPSIIKMPAMVAMIEVAGSIVSGEKYAKMKSEIATGLAPLHEKEDEAKESWRGLSSRDPRAIAALARLGGSRSLEGNNAPNKE
jgi:hypothetical protein